MMEGEAKGSFADGIVDELLPDDLDWRELVVTYPIPALLLSALGGFLLGSRHGDEIRAAFMRYTEREVARVVTSRLGDDVRG